MNCSFTETDKDPFLIEILRRCFLGESGKDISRERLIANLLKMKDELLSQKRTKEGAGKLSERGKHNLLLKMSVLDNLAKIEKIDEWIHSNISTS
jgi:hypothetical protein